MATLPKTGRISTGQVTAGDIPQLRAPRDPGARVPNLNIGTGLAAGFESFGKSVMSRFEQEDEAVRKMELARADAETQIQTNALFNSLVEKNDPSTFEEDLEQGLREIGDSQLKSFGNDDTTRSAYEIGFEKFRGDVLTKGMNTARTLRLQNGFTQTNDLLDVLQGEANKALLAGDKESRDSVLEQINHIISTAEETAFFSTEEASAKREEVQIGLLRGRYEFLKNSDPRAAELFMLSESTSMLPMEERQQKIGEARDAFYTQIVRQQRQDDRRRAEDERIVEKRQRENYTKLLVTANRGDLDLEQAEKMLLDQEISAEQFNGLTNIDLQADTRTSQERLLDYENAFRELESIGSATPNSTGQSKGALISQMHRDVEQDAMLLANDKMKVKTRLESIENNTDVMETSGFKEARRLMDMGLGDPRNLLEAKIGSDEKQRALAANYEFTKRVFEFGEDPMTVAKELLDREHETFRKLDTPFIRSRIDIELRGIPKEFHSFTAMQGQTVPSTETMKMFVREAALNGSITKKQVKQYSEHIQELEGILSPFQEAPEPEPKQEPQGPEPSSFMENTKTIAKQVFEDVKSLLMENGLIPQAEASVGKAVAPEVEPKPSAETKSQIEPAQSGTDSFNPLEGGQPVSEDIVKAINQASSTTKIDPDILKALIAAESSFDMNAASGESTASGLFQITEATREEMGLDEKDAFDTQKNIEAGAKHLASLKQIAIDSGVEDEVDQRALMIMGHRIGQTALRAAIKKAQKGGDVTAMSVLLAMPKDRRENAHETLGKVLKLMKAIHKNRGSENG